MMPAKLVLEDGRAFYGRRFGHVGDVGGEAVFNTSMIGYQEILGDPSYAGQLIVMTYPMMGNYGVAAEDFESARCHARGLIVKESSRISSNWRHDRSLDDYLKTQRVVGLCDVDTRAIVRHLRDRGAMRGIIADAASIAPDETAWAQRAQSVPSMGGLDLAAQVSTAAAYGWDVPTPTLGSDVKRPPPRHHVVVLDYGVKRNILRCLVDAGCKVTVLPAKSTAAMVMAHQPDGVLLSNGPGDPEPVTYGVRTIRDLLGSVPLFGICLGHQLLAIAVGAKSYKLKFGHRGANHPVMELATRKVEITAQNHGFSIDPESLRASAVEVTHLNLNDQTLAGLRLREYPAFAVQYHPEAAPGPHDGNYLFKRFTRLMDECTKKKAQ